MKAKRRSAGAEGQYVNWLLAILVIAILLALLVPSVSAGWYRRNVTIDNTGGGILTDYQVLVSITDHTHMDNGDSIRFTDTGNSIKYDYWIEKWKDGGSRIWVEVPSVPADATSEMYMWYGDSGASKESSGAATFTFFDDFDNNDISNWEKKLFQSGNDKGAISAQNNKLVVNATGTDAKNRAGACTKEVPLSQGKKFEAKVVSLAEDANLIQVIYYSKDNVYENIPYTDDKYKVWKVVNKKRTDLHGSVTTYNAPYYPYVEYYRSEDNKVRVHFGTRSSVEVCSDVSPWANFKLGFYTYNKGTITIDWVFVREYASPEPGTTVSGDVVNGGGGAPVPELPTILLFSVGLLVLAGYVSLRRREKKKVK